MTEQRRGLWRAVAVLATIGIAAVAVVPAAARQATTATAPGAPPPKKPLLQTTFAGSDDGWTTLGAKARARVAADADRKALRFEYAVEKGDVSLLLLPVGPTEIAGAKSFRFSVRADQSTTLALVLQEQGGGRWLAAFHAPGGKWQEVALADADFTLSEGKNDPNDDNRALDMEKVEAIGLADLTQLFVQSGDAALATLFGAKSGERSLLLGTFTVEAVAPAHAGTRAATSYLDAFAAPQLGWMGIGGGAALARAPAGKPLTEPGLQVGYRREAGKLAGALRPVSLPQRARLARSGGITVTLASERPAQVLVQLEEKGGGKYNTLVAVPGGKEANMVKLLFTDFKPAQDSKDTNGRLDPEDVNNLFFLDVSALLDAGAGGVENTLWIGGLRASSSTGV